jgi:hypothetical protein
MYSCFFLCLKIEIKRNEILSNGFMDKSGHVLDHKNSPFTINLFSPTAAKQHPP